MHHNPSAPALFVSQRRAPRHLTALHVQALPIPRGDATVECRFPALSRGPSIPGPADKAKRLR